MKKNNSFLIAALDIGTSKVHALIAECTPNLMEIIAIGVSPSYGLKKGVVLNIETTSQSIRQAIKEAERMANVKIQKVYTGIAGSHIRSFNSYGAVAIEQKEEVTQTDVDKVVEVAKAVSIPKDQKFLHVIPKEFSVDRQRGIRDPIGMSGVRLETQVHVVTSAVNATQNIAKCVKNCGLEIADIVLEPLASSQSVLTEDEKELGVCLIDIGGGTSDLAVFSGGSIRHTAVLPIAGDHVTRDLAILLQTSTESAEMIKRKYACALPELAGNEWIAIPNVSNEVRHNMTMQTLAEVVNARCEELLKLVRQELHTYDYLDQLPAGLVITGGGSHVRGMVDLAKKFFDCPVRHGFPNYHGSMEETLRHGSHSTGVGLILHGYRHSQQVVSEPFWQSIYKPIRAWLQNNF